MAPVERGSRASRATAAAVSRVRKTREQFQELTGYEAESVSGLAHVENGWSVEVDVVEFCYLLGNRRDRDSLPHTVEGDPDLAATLLRAAATLGCD